MQRANDRGRYVAMIVSALLPFAVDAQALPERLLACAAIADVDSRLTCFDLLAAEQARPSTATEPRRGVATAPAFVTPGLSPEERFGREQQLVYRSTTGDEALSEITASVVRLTERSDGRLTVELDNGQAWAQSEVASQTVPLSVGDTVRIRRGAVGSFQLITANSRSFRVRRIR